MPKIFLDKIASKANHLYKLYVLRDPFLQNVRRWFADQGDQTLRLNYRLDKSSVVFDVGGYLGDYADEVYKKFGCFIYLFEPVPEFYNQCVKRFTGNSSVRCWNYGLSSISGKFEICLNNNESSFKWKEEGGVSQLAELRSIVEAINELGVEKIDLIKINIEGGEFDLLSTIIDCGLINRIKYVQVQFHNFVEDAAENRLRLRKLLEKTHFEMWSYEFVWESWELLEVCP